jgi:hypothetical protein
MMTHPEFSANGELGIGRADALIEHEHLGPQAGDDREAQARHHPRGVRVDRVVDSRAQAGELEGLGRDARDLLASQTELDTQGLGVLPAGRLLVQAQIRPAQKGQDATSDRNTALRRQQHAGDHAQQRGLARAVGTQQPDAFAVVDAEADIAQRIDDPPLLMAAHEGVHGRSLDVLVARSEVLEVHAHPSSVDHCRPPQT